jgi:hypothetical protein
MAPLFFIISMTFALLSGHEGLFLTTRDSFPKLRIPWDGRNRVKPVLPRG